MNNWGLIPTWRAIVSRALMIRWCEVGVLCKLLCSEEEIIRGMDYRVIRLGVLITYDDDKLSPPFFALYQQIA
jgi:hypothetical protein